MLSESKKLRVAVLGSGSWATAQISLLTNNVDHINWFVRDAKTIEYIRKHKRNPKYVSDLILDTEKLNLSNNINDVVSDSDIILVAIPSAFCRDILKNIKCDISNKYIVSSVKGIILDENQTLAEYMHDEFHIPFANMCIISGPCHAEEIATQQLSYLTFASKKLDVSEAIAKLYAAHFIRAIISNDIYGTEYGAILKNIYAVGVGICLGLGYGDNFIAVLTANSHREMKRFLNESYPSERNTSRSSYLGDLLVTCYSQHSRNRKFGTLIGSGFSASEATAQMQMIAEGYYASKGIFEKNKRLNIGMPIADAVYKILYKQTSAASEIKKLTKLLR